MYVILVYLKNEIEFSQDCDGNKKAPSLGGHQTEDSWRNGVTSPVVWRLFSFAEYVGAASNRLEIRTAPFWTDYLRIVEVSRTSCPILRLPSQPCL